MEVDVSPPPVIGGVVEYDINIPNHFIGDFRIEQVCLFELYRPVPQWSLDILEQTAAEIVDDSNVRPTFNKSVDKMRAYE